MSVKDYARKKNKWLLKLKQWIDTEHPGDILIPFSGRLEEDVALLATEEEKVAYLKGIQDEYKLTTPVVSVLPKIIVSGYNTLSLQYFYTGGADEVRAWTIRKGYKAPQAAGTIHTDFQTGFIKAEVFSFDDLKEHGSEVAVKAAGKFRSEGKTYVMRPGDICNFLVGSITAPKKK